MKKKIKVWLCVAIAFLLIGSIGASLVRTSGNTVQLIDTYIPDVEGTFIHATIFKPKTATAENPAPVVVTCHGYSDSGEKQDFAAIELSRRGVVVVEMDAKSHGLSSTSTIDSSPASTFGEGCGFFNVIDFLMESHLDYIDKSQLGITGHSMGGLATMATIEHYGAMQTAALEAASLPDSDGGASVTENELENARALNPVKAAFIQSALPSSNPEDYGNYYIPVALNYTYYDEGNYTTANGNGDLKTAPEALAFVNSILPEESQIATVELGKTYGSIEDGTLRVVYNPPSLHTCEYLTPECATNLVNFFSMCFDIDTTISATNHIFLYRFLFSAIALLGLAILIPLLVIALLKTEFFSKIVVTTPEAKVTLNSKKDKLIFWGCWALITAITVFLLVPIIRLDAKIFPVVASMGYAKLYTSINVNSFAIWDVFIALVILIIFLVLYFTKLKKDGWTLNDLGLKISGKQLIRCILLALTVGCIYYGIVFGIYYILKVDLRAWAISAKPFNPDKISMWIQYLPWFFVYMFAQALATNTINRVKDQKHNLLINVLGNIAGLVIIAVFAYTYLFTVGVTFPAWQTAWDRVMQVIPFTFYTAASVIITRKCFEKTGTIWVGTFVNTFIITMMLVANTSMFLTLH